MNEKERRFIFSDNSRSRSATVSESGFVAFTNGFARCKEVFDEGQSVTLRACHNA